MELKNYYRLVLSNQQEYFIESEFDNVIGFINYLDSNEKYFALKLKDSDPVFFRLDHLLSIQAARQGIIGAQTKLWRLT